MKQTGRDRALFVILLLLKIATALQTGADTLAVTGSWLAVILIDLAFLALWSYLAYAGGGKEAQRNKAYAALGATLLYSAMFVIGLQAHGGQFWALAVRLSGAVALGFDVWTFAAAAVTGWWSGVRQWRKTRPAPEIRQRARLRTKMVRRGQRKAARTLRHRVVELIQDDWRDSLPDMLPDRVPDMPDVPGEDVITVQAQRVWTKTERHRELPALVGGHDDDELATRFGVSERTIRRDKAELGLD